MMVAPERETRDNRQALAETDAQRQPGRHRIHVHDLRLRPDALDD